MPLLKAVTGSIRVSDILQCSAIVSVDEQAAGQRVKDACVSVHSPFTIDWPHLKDSFLPDKHRQLYPILKNDDLAWCPTPRRPPLLLLHCNC